MLSADAVYTSDLVINVITILQYEAYAIIAIASLSTVLWARLKESSSLDFDSVGPSSGQMRNGYIIYIFLIGLPCLPFVVVGVFGLDLLGATLVPAVLSPNLSQNFAVLSAPIFLLGLLISVMTVELSRQYREADD